MYMLLLPCGQSRSGQNPDCEKTCGSSTHGGHKFVVVGAKHVAAARKVWRAPASTTTTTTGEWTRPNWIEPGTRRCSHWWKEAVSAPGPTQPAFTPRPAVAKYGMIWAHKHTVASVVGREQGRWRERIRWDRIKITATDRERVLR